MDASHTLQQSSNSALAEADTDMSWHQANGALVSTGPTSARRPWPTRNRASAARSPAAARAALPTRPFLLHSSRGTEAKRP